MNKIKERREKVKQETIERMREIANRQEDIGEKKLLHAIINELEKGTMMGLNQDIEGQYFIESQNCRFNNKKDSGLFHHHVNEYAIELKIEEEKKLDEWLKQ